MSIKIIKYANYNFLDKELILSLHRPFDLIGRMHIQFRKGRVEHDSLKYSIIIRGMDTYFNHLLVTFQ